MRAPVTTLGLVALVLATLASVEPKPKRPAITLLRRYSALDATTFWVVYRVTPPAPDNFGPVDSLITKAGFNSVPAGYANPAPHRLVGVAQLDSFNLPKALPGVAPRPGFYCAGSKRRTHTSTDACVQWQQMQATDVPPGPPTVDSLRVVGIILKPDSVKVDTLKTQRFCAYAKMEDSSVVATTNNGLSTYCDSIGRTIPHYVVASRFRPVPFRLAVQRM